MRYPLSVLVDPAAAFAALYPSGDAFWFAGESVHYLGTGQRLNFSDTAVLPTLAAELTDMRTGADLEGVPLGLIGWFGYELYRETTGIPAPAEPSSAVLRVDRLLRVKQNGEAELLTLGDECPGDECYSELSAWCTETTKRLTALTAAQASGAKPQQSAKGGTRARWQKTPEEYLAGIESAQSAIREGEVYQLCLTNQVSLAGVFDPFTIFQRTRAANPTRHSAFLRIGETALIGASPESFLRVTSDGRVSTSPVKGTRARGKNPVEDARAREELLASEKERAENLMIVDLMRNDLARVCAAGSVRVSRLFQVESYRHVHQLVSRVEGKLSVGHDALAAFTACFPAGSMTGAPKLRAIQLLQELEGRARGAYAGAYGFFGADGSANLAMTIRSILIERDGARIGSGGGITALSVPEDELYEVAHKAAALLAALGEN